MRPVQEAGQHQQDTGSEQKTSGGAAVGEQVVFRILALVRTKMPDQSNQESQGGDQRQQSAKIGKDAGPADGFQRAMRKSHVMNKKDTDRKQPTTKKKEPSPSLPGLL